MPYSCDITTGVLMYVVSAWLLDGGTSQLDNSLSTAEGQIAY